MVALLDASVASQGLEEGTSWGNNCSPSGEKRKEDNVSYRHVLHYHGTLSHLNKQNIPYTKRSCVKAIMLSFKAKQYSEDLKCLV